MKEKGRAERAKGKQKAGSTPTNDSNDDIMSYNQRLGVSVTRTAHLRASIRWNKKK